MQDNEIILQIKARIESILSAPMTINQEDFIEIYNKVYSFCTRTSQTYEIQGAEIYNVLAKSLEKFFDNAEFSASIPKLYQQILLFNLSYEIIANIFRYLERFYIKTSILNGSPVKRLADLFFYKVYYSYIYKIEENLLNLIFLEIETLRKNHIQELTYIKTIVEFYVNALTKNDQTTALSSFYKKYIADFKQSFNPNTEVGRMLKKLYLEVFFATNLFTDKEISKEIILTVISRKDEILDFTFMKIRNFEKIKHIFKIINQMPDTVRSRMKDRYREFIRDELKRSNDFECFYDMFKKITDQIKVNKMTNFDELLEEEVVKSFKEKTSAVQGKIIEGLVSLMNSQIIEVNYKLSQLLQENYSTTDEQCSLPESLSCKHPFESNYTYPSHHVPKAIKFDKIYSETVYRSTSNNSALNDSLYTNDRVSIMKYGLPSKFKNKANASLDVNANEAKRLPDNLPSSGPQKFKNSNEKANYNDASLTNSDQSGQSDSNANKSNMVEMIGETMKSTISLFCLLADEYSADKVMESIQSRLLIGYSPDVEQVFSAILIEKLGLGLMSKIKNSVNSFISKEIFLFESNSLKCEIDVNLVKLTKGFWTVEKDEVELYPDLKTIVTRCVEYIQLEERQKLEFNFSLSPILVDINQTIYKMASDIFSVYLHILKNGHISMGSLREIVKDKKLDKHLKTLIDSGLIIMREENNSSYLVTSNIKRVERYVDLFTIDKKKEILKAESQINADNTFIYEAKVCKHLKKHKSLTRESIIEFFNDNNFNVNSVIDILISKGYLEEKDGNILYVP